MDEAQRQVVEARSALMVDCALGRVVAGWSLGYTLFYLYILFEFTAYAVAFLTPLAFSSQCEHAMVNITRRPAMPHLGCIRDVLLCV
jgi:hypothetical protein